MPTEFMPNPMALLSDGTVLTEGIGEQPGGNDSDACTAAVFTRGPGRSRPSRAWCGAPTGPPRSCSMARSSWQVAASATTSKSASRMASRSCTSLPACPCRRCQPSRARPRQSSRARPRGRRRSRRTGPVPPNAHSWKVTVDNDSSEPVTLFVVGDGESGISRLVGSATPNVVPAGTTVRVTFLFPDKGDNGWIYVNPRPGEGEGWSAGPTSASQARSGFGRTGRGVGQPVAEQERSGLLDLVPPEKQRCSAKASGKSSRYRRPGLLASNG